jgi:transketolase
MPSWELFEQQDEAYREDILPASVSARVAVEAGSVIGWDRYAGPGGTIIGMHTFGGSAPGTDLMKKFGFVAVRVLQAAKDQIAKHQSIESLRKPAR